jgi:hypothetical protein
VLKLFDGLKLLVHLQVTKTDYGTLFFLGSNGEWRSLFTVSQCKAKLCDDAESRDKGVICWHARTESSTANPQNILRMGQIRNIYQTLMRRDTWENKAYMGE